MSANYSAVNPKPGPGNRFSDYDGHELDSYYNEPGPYRLSTHSSVNPILSKSGSRHNSGLSLSSGGRLSEPYSDIPPGAVDPFSGDNNQQNNSSNRMAAPVATSAGSYAALDSPGKEAGAYYDPQGRAGRRYAERQAELTPYAVEAAAGKASKKKKVLWIVGVGVLVVVAVVAVAVGVTVGRKSGSGGKSSASDASTGGTAVTVGSDPSVFEKNPALKQSFWGMAYTPQSSLLPDCGANLNNITLDIQLLSQLTTRIRLYGANCNVTAMVLQAIQDTKVNMSVAIAIYVDSNTQAYNDQVTAISDALKTYGTDHVMGVTVGNEYILNSITPSADTTLPAAVAAIAKIKSDIQDVNSTVKALGLSKSLPIGTSDAGSIFTTGLAEGVDYFQANTHPWFAGVSIDIASWWTTDFFTTWDVDVAAEVSNNPATYIAETGWPTATMNASEGNNGFAGSKGDASLANLQVMLDTFICNNTNYYWFEAYDEPWKMIYGGVEPYWGLMDEHRVLKNITIPTC